MKKFLPKTVNNPQGFTLIELMVVIAIIAILSTIGLTLFTNTQQKARDTRRRSDIDAIANALETNKTPGSSTYNVLAGTQFNAGTIPADSGNGSAVYCVSSTTTAGTPPAVATAWVNTSACPTTPSGYTLVSATNPAGTAGSWTLCTLLETGANPANIYCKQNAQ